MAHYLNAAIFGRKTCFNIMGGSLFHCSVKVLFFLSVTQRVLNVENATTLSEGPIRWGSGIEENEERSHMLTQLWLVASSYIISSLLFVGARLELTLNDCLGRVT